MADINEIIAFYAASKNYTDGQIATLPKPFVYRGTVSYQSQLPSNASVGEVYTVLYKGVSPSTEQWGAEFVWGTYQGTNQWIRLGADTEGNYLPLTGGTMTGNIAFQPQANTNIAVTSEADTFSDTLTIKAGNTTGTVVGTTELDVFYNYNTGRKIIMPASDNDVELGRTDKRFKQLFVNTIRDGDTTGTNSITVAQMVAKQDQLVSTGANPNVIAPLYVDEGELRLEVGNGVKVASDTGAIEAKPGLGVRVASSGIICEGVEYYNNTTAQSNALKFVRMTASQYASITPDANTFYIIVE